MRCWFEVQPLLSAGVEPLTEFSKMGVEDLTGPQFLEGVVWKEGVTFFRGGRGGELQFLQKKKKIKSEIFNDKKSL